MSVLREVLAVVGIDVDDKQLKELDKKINKTQQSLAGLGAAFAAFGAAAAIKGAVGLVNEVSAANAHIVDLSQRLGVSTDELQFFGYVSGLVGVDIDSAANSLSFFNRQLGKAAEGNKGAQKAVAFLGNTFKDATGHVKPIEELLPSVADHIAKLGDAGRQTAELQALFGRGAQNANFLPFLQKGAEGIDNVRKQFEKLGLRLSGSDLQEMKNYTQQTNILDMSFESMKARIATRLIPIFQDFLPLIEKGVDKFKDWAGRTHGLQESLGALAAVLIGGGAAAGSIGLLAALSKLPALIKAVEAGMALLEAELLPLLIPILEITAAVAALYIFFEDLVHFLRGDSSLIGTFMEALFGKEATASIRDNFLYAMEQVFDAFKKLGVTASTLKPYLRAIFIGIGALLTGVAVLIIKLLTAIMTTISSVVGAIGKLVKGDLKGAAEDIADIPEKIIKSLRNKKQREEDAKRQQEQEAARAALAAGGGGPVDSLEQDKIRHSLGNYRAEELPKGFQKVISPFYKPSLQASFSPPPISPAFAQSITNNITISGLGPDAKPKDVAYTIIKETSKHEAEKYNAFQAVVTGGVK
jgi:hypothetical protein